jgi:putative transposase
MSSHVFHQLYYHIVWSTKDRLPLIVDDVRAKLIGWIVDECRARKAIVLACNAMPDHVHIFITTPPTVCLSEFIGQVKGACSYAHNHHIGAENHLLWQEGYGVATVRKAEADKVIRYVDNQPEVHANRQASRLLETTSNPDGMSVR